MNERQELLKQVMALEPWFYTFDLGNGEIVHSKLPKNIQGIHETRLQMVLSAVEQHFDHRLSSARCLDVGCHEGYFSFEMAKKVMSVTGIDVRKESLQKAELIKKINRAENTNFRYGDCYELDQSELYDLTLFLGVLYHLSNPIGALLSMAKVTKELCVIETQVIDDIGGQTEWGNKDWHREYKGMFALIDERSEYDGGCPEAGSFGLVLCPSLNALLFILRTVGFKRIELITPPVNGYEQHMRGKRVILAAAK
ncbi:MAG: methyltransferase domain-containing protein [Nitrosospira sp.]|nr:methyltransferase domain-containing protein [Nitrosospira sp.]